MAKDEFEVALTRLIQGDLSRRQFLWGTGLALGTIGLAACGGGTTTPTAGPVPVGSVLDGTGGLNIYGTVMIDATTFAVDAINKKGGVLGRQLKLTAFDAQSTNDKYVQYADQLMLETKAAVIMGGITSGSREAIRPSIDKNKQLYFYNEQYEGGVCDKYVFCTGVVPSQQLSTLVKWTMDNVGKTVYTLAADYNYGHISSDWVKFYLNKNGGTLLGVDFIPLDVADFGSTLTKLQLKNPTNQKWVADWKTRFGANYPYITDSANAVWTGWHFWAQAVNKAGTVDRDKVIAALESGLSFDAPEGTVHLDGKSHHLTHNVNIAQTNANHGFNIIQTLSAISPDPQGQCDLIAKPDQHTQFTPSL